MYRQSIGKGGVRRYVLPQFELKIARGKKENCEICENSFGVFTREHQCKRCRRAVCEKCATHKQHVVENNKRSEKPHRLCSVCKVDRDFI